MYFKNTPTHIFLQLKRYGGTLSVSLGGESASCAAPGLCDVVWLLHGWVGAPPTRPILCASVGTSHHLDLLLMQGTRRKPASGSRIAGSNIMFTFNFN